jgi:hypothetical protein
MMFTQNGILAGVWMRLCMPSTGVVESVRGYGNDVWPSAVTAEDPAFAGLVGLPILRLGEYGGNTADFWFRYPPS